MNDNMDEPEKHYAKLDIPGTKKQIVHDNHLYQKPNIVKTCRSRKQNGGFQGLGQERMREVLIKECTVSLMQDN